MLGHPSAGPAGVSLLGFLLLCLVGCDTGAPSSEIELLAGDSIAARENVCRDTTSLPRSERACLLAARHNQYSTAAKLQACADVTGLPHSYYDCLKYSARPTLTVAEIRDCGDTGSRVRFLECLSRWSRD